MRSLLYRVARKTDVEATVRLLNLSMQSEYLTLFQATNLVARYAVGHGILRPESSIEVVTTI